MEELDKAQDFSSIHFSLEVDASSLKLLSAERFQKVSVFVFKFIVEILIECLHRRDIDYVNIVMVSMGRYGNRTLPRC